MPIQKKWSRLTKDNLKKLGNIRGAYEVANRNKKTLDIGKGESTNTGVAGRIKTKKKLYPSIQYFRVEEENIFENGRDIEAKHAKAYQGKYGRRTSKNRRSPRVRRSIFDI